MVNPTNKLHYPDETAGFHHLGMYCMFTTIHVCMYVCMYVVCRYVLYVLNPSNRIFLRKVQLGVANMSRLC